MVCVLNFRRKLNLFFFIFVFIFEIPSHAEFLDNSTTALEERIAPIGKVKVTHSKINLSSLTDANQETQLGEKIFETKCILCHKNGIAGAPRLGNQLDWALRIKKKFSLLLKHVITGYRAMPPKGTCFECSISDLKAAINYMLEQLRV